MLSLCFANQTPPPKKKLLPELGLYRQLREHVLYFYILYSYVRPFVQRPQFYPCASFSRPHQVGGETTALTGLCKSHFHIHIHVHLVTRRISMTLVGTSRRVVTFFSTNEIVSL